MKILTKTPVLTCLFLSFTILFTIKAQGPKRHIQTNEDSLKKEINAFVDEWHSDAAHANLNYFKKIDENGIFIGTDKTEVWTKDAFYNFSKKYFERGKAWDFKASERHIYFSDKKDYAWFDELLDTWMGPCRSSGVLKRTKDSWIIEHYQLSVAIPNEVIKEVIKVIQVSDSLKVITGK